MLLSDGHNFFLCFPVSPFSFPDYCEPFQVLQLQLVSLSPSCSTAFSTLWHGPSICSSFHFLSFSLCGPSEQKKIIWKQICFFLLIYTRSSRILGRVLETWGDLLSQKGHQSKLAVKLSQKDHQSKLAVKLVNNNNNNNLLAHGFKYSYQSLIIPTRLYGFSSNTNNFRRKLYLGSRIKLRQAWCRGFQLFSSSSSTEPERKARSCLTAGIRVVVRTGAPCLHVSNPSFKKIPTCRVQQPKKWS